MFNLDLEKMLDNTSSEQIHIWKKSQGKIKSKATDDPVKAYAEYQKGASLYFGASIEFRNLYMKCLNMQMGHNFGGYYQAGQDITSMEQLGEIETFVSRAGNYTDWHTDFQENFTVQLKGKKTWKLQRSGLEAPLTGFTPHYKGAGTIEMQQKVHKAYNSVDMSK